MRYNKIVSQNRQKLFYRGLDDYLKDINNILPVFLFKMPESLTLH